MKCSICHGELPDPKGICPGSLPGPIGLVEFSPGKCLSTPLQRAEATARRADAAAKAAQDRT